MSLPPFPEVHAETLAAIAALHGVKAAEVVRLPQVGIFNEIYGLGERLILRVPRAHPRFTDAARNEAAAVPLARAAGVRTPALVAFDDSGELLDVPFSVYERVAGRHLEALLPDPATASAVWRELGRDLARLHAGVARTKAALALRPFEQKTDPRPLPEIIATAGYFGSSEAVWLKAWLERLAPHALAPPDEVFIHDDTQAANTMVDETTLEYRAVIDWGSCRWSDPANDFAGVALRAVPALLEGYRGERATDDTIEARIVWRHLQIGLHQLRGKPKPEQSWGERPMGILLDVLRFFAGDVDARWRQWAP